MASLTEYLRTGLNPDIDSDTPADIPMVSGWMFASIYVPDEVFDNPSDTSTTISTRVLAVDLSDITIATGERIGLGGLKQIVPTSIDLSHTVSIRMQEMEKSNIIGILTTWVNKIRNISTGIQTVSKYKGHLDLAIVTPALEPFLCLRFIGIFPTQIPLSNLQPDVTNNSLIEITEQFYFDRIKEISVSESSTIESILNSVKQ